MENLKDMRNTLEMFAMEARCAAEDLRRFGGSTRLAGKRFTFRDAGRLEKVASDIGAFLDGDASELERMMRIARMADEGNRIPATAMQQAPHGKTYAVNRSMRYRIGLFLDHLDEVRRSMEAGETASAEVLGKTYTDAADFGDFVNSVRRLKNETESHDVPGSAYGLARQYSEEGMKLEEARMAAAGLPERSDT